MIGPGLSAEISIVVEEKDTARSSGGATLPPVLSTPRLIGLIEQAAHRSILAYLQEGQTTVGTHVDIRHLAATPVGMEVRFQAELIEVDGRRLRFKVQAFDQVEKVGEGEHERFIIDSSRFQERVEKKRLEAQ